MTVKSIFPVLLTITSFSVLNGQVKPVIGKVLILGNSIVAHDPKPDIGWTGNWGMAASCVDSDFVHVLTRMIRSVKKDAIVEARNIAVFERTYESYQLEQLRPLLAFDPDMIIIKISENVNDSLAIQNDFEGYYKKLLNYLDPRNRAIKVLVDGFWAKPHVNRIVNRVAVSGGYDFVAITALDNDDTNTAKGQFEHVGVARHPSDKGMRLIAEHIWSVIQKYFRS